jgi:undecaprenyl diphosphate synthase
MEDGIKILTVYVFSTENWNREAHEIQTLMTILGNKTWMFPSVDSVQG